MDVYLQFRCRVLQGNKWSLHPQENSIKKDIKWNHQLNFIELLIVVSSIWILRRISINKLIDKINCRPWLSYREYSSESILIVGKFFACTCTSFWQQHIILSFYLFGSETKNLNVALFGIDQQYLESRQLMTRSVDLSNINIYFSMKKMKQVLFVEPGRYFVFDEITKYALDEWTFLDLSQSRHWYNANRMWSP